MTNMFENYEFVNLSEQEMQDFFMQHECPEELQYFFMTLLRMMFNTKSCGPFGFISYPNQNKRNQAIRLMTGLRKDHIQKSIEYMVDKGMLSLFPDGSITSSRFFQKTTIITGDHKNGRVCYVH